MEGGSWMEGGREWDEMEGGSGMGWREGVGWDGGREWYGMEGGSGMGYPIQKTQGCNNLVTRLQQGCATTLLQPG